jgi:N-carbamoylputrescine amidase
MMDMSALTIGLAAAKFKNNDVTLNFDTVVRFLQDAKKQGVDLLLFGECFLQGFEALSWKPDIDLNIGIEKDSDSIRSLREQCRTMNIALGVGYIEKENGKLFSSYIIIDNNGNELTNYRRISRYWRTKDSDDNTYQEGSKFETFEYYGYKMTVGLCGDFWTDEVIALVPKDVDVVLWPVFVHWPKEEWIKTQFSEYITQAKTICKNIFFVNSICEEEKSPANGACFAVIENELRYSLDMGKEEMLCFRY